MHIKVVAVFTALSWQAYGLAHAQLTLSHRDAIHKHRDALSNFCSWRTVVPSYVTHGPAHVRPYRGGAQRKRPTLCSSSVPSGITIAATPAHQCSVDLTCTCGSNGTQSSKSPVRTRLRVPVANSDVEGCLPEYLVERKLSDESRPVVPQL